MPKIKANPLAMLFHLIKNDAHKLETDPETQWKFHRKMSWFWLSNFIVVPVLYWGFPAAWIQLGLLFNTFYSLYANFATEFGAIPSSYAAMNTEKMTQNVISANEQLQDAVDDVADDVDDIKDQVVPDEPPAPDPGRIHVFSEA